jgi:3-methyladenine DNA glycosylase AlkC
LAEPFKLLLNARGVHDLARHLHRAWPGFDAARFEALALDGLDALELKARAMHVADALEATLPADFALAADAVEASLGPPGDGDGPGARPDADAGLCGWPLWPVGEFVARRGIDAPQRALRTLHAVTQRFTAEWAIRPFIVAHPALAFATLQRWTADPSAQVRRLVSEGSRPRLPWGMRLRALVADPSPTLPLLRALQDDPSEVVRRSVANHLNDIAKDHPDLIVRWLDEHLPGAPAERRALLKHASRTLIKQGHPAVMSAWGFGRRFAGDVQFALAPKRVAVGEALTLAVRLDSSSARAQPLQIDYAVHHVKASGSTSPKVFKGWSLVLGANEQRALSKRHSMRAVTTRTYHPGRHEVELLVNGEVRARSGFELSSRSGPAGLLGSPRGTAGPAGLEALPSRSADAGRTLRPRGQGPDGGPAAKAISAPGGAPSRPRRSRR